MHYNFLILFWQHFLPIYFHCFFWLFEFNKLTGCPIKLGDRFIFSRKQSQILMRINAQGMKRIPVLMITIKSNPIRKKRTLFCIGYRDASRFGIFFDSSYRME
jgi:hypothetical protein